MRLLIIGGTRFLGPAIVEHALERAHEVILFNRGITNPGLFPQLEHIRGDRNHNIDRLAGRRFDAVIDTCGYIPRQVRDAVRTLHDHVEHYLFVSTVSVYPDDGIAGKDESSPVRRLDLSPTVIEALTVDDIDFTNYGALKAGCEQAATEGMDGRATNVRPGMIVGPRDASGRFHYWPWRMDRGGEILAPGPRTAPQQLIDVRDLGAFCVRLVEEGHTGTYNATGPSGPLPTDELLYACKSATSTSGHLTWVDESFLLKQDVGMWQIPLWVPQQDPLYRGFNTIDIARAVAHGLTHRPLAETCIATLEDVHANGLDRSWPQGERIQRASATLLKQWHDRER